uniref:Secreted protein n=1 Tax=Ixodes ricinus TaxID=34613 RepID=A0A6B0U1T6_IXORI
MRSLWFLLFMCSSYWFMEFSSTWQYLHRSFMPTSLVSSRVWVSLLVTSREVMGTLNLKHRFLCRRPPRCSASCLALLVYTLHTRQCTILEP